MGEKSSKEFDWILNEKKVPNWECLSVQRNQGYSYKKTWTIYIVLMWKKLMKEVDVDEPTSFLDHVYYGCIQRDCKPNDDMLEQWKYYLGGTNFMQKTMAWSYDKCTANWRNKRAEQLYTFSSLCFDDHQFKKEDLNQLENHQKFDHKCFL